MEPTDLSVKPSTKKSHCTPRSSPRDVTNIETSHSKLKMSKILQFLEGKIQILWNYIIFLFFQPTPPRAGQQLSKIAGQPLYQLPHLVSPN